MDDPELDASQYAGPADAPDTCGQPSPDSPAASQARLAATYIPVSTQLPHSVTPIQCVSSSTVEEEADGLHALFSGFGVAPGTLELIKLQRPALANKPSLPLQSSPSVTCPISQEYNRPWRALCLGAEPEPTQSDGLPQDQSLLKNYEPQFQAGAPTFPPAVEIPAYLRPRVAVDEASAFVVVPHVRFSLEQVEPLFCHVMVYDISLNSRITEEYHFTVAGPALSKTTSSGTPSSVDCSRTHMSADLRAALLYILPNHQPHQLYLVLKVTKILSGDGDSATAPYCNPEKAFTRPEQQKLIDRAVDCSQRLGRYRQPLAWGAIPLMEGIDRPMTLYRQRAAMSDEVRIPMIPDAVRGTLKEKVIPATCEFDLKRVDQDDLLIYKHHPHIQASARSNDVADTQSEISPGYSIIDPFTASIGSTQHTPRSDSTSTTSEHSGVICCREVQPFCHSSMTSLCGLTGSGPVATSFVNVLYVYPFRLDRFQHRNIAIQVQLLEREVNAIGSVTDTELRQEVLPALYCSDGNGVVRSGYTLVSYHQKSPQFENEFKICLPEQLSQTHHVLFTFYHVHCKKLQATQQQQDLIGYAVLPLIEKDGTILGDASYSMAVYSAPTPAKQAKSSQGMDLPPNYVQCAREAGSDCTGRGMSFSCRTRALSSVYSQDKAVAALLGPFHSSVDHTVTTNDDIVLSLIGLRQANVLHLRYFLLSVTRFVLEYLRSGPSVVRWAAFRALLAIFEKASCSAHRSLKPQLQEANQILHHYVQVIFDEEVMASSGADEARQEPLYRAIMKEWLHVLRDNEPTEENVETKRVSIVFSNVLLQLVLKSMAMTQSSKRSDLYAKSAITATRMLPQRFLREDDLLIERLANELTLCAANASLGLLLQKEANQSIAWFCRGLFLVVLNSVPGRVICRYIESMERNSSDPNTLVHLLFPFLQILTDFELFATVNGATTEHSPPKSSTSPVNLSPSMGKWTYKRAWLARAIFCTLLRVVDEQKELKISCGAARLIRHLFVVHVQNPRCQTRAKQEAIALAYAPFLTVLAEFTADNKLFAGGGSSGEKDESANAISSSLYQLKKELLVCVAHLLSVVSSASLPRFYTDGPEKTDVPAPEEESLNKWRQALALSPTSALMHYRKVVDKRNAIDATCPKKPMLPRIAEISAPVSKLPVSSDARAKSPPFDEVRVHACFALIRHVIDVFLVEVTSSQPDQSSASPLSPWKRFLSPSLTTSEALLSLQELEYQVKHRGSHHRISTTSLDEAAVTARRSNTPASNNSQNLGTSTRLGHSSSVLAMTAASTGPRTPLQRSMPRTWGKNHAITQHRRGTSDAQPLDGKSISNSSLMLKSGVESTRKLAMTPLQEHEEEYCATNLRRIIAKAVLRAIQTAVDQFEHVLRLVEAPFDHQRARGASVRESSATVDQAYALLGSLTDLLFFLLWRASSINNLSGCDASELAVASRDDRDSSSGNHPACVVTELLAYLISSLERFQKSFFSCRVPGLPLIHDVRRVEQLMTIACMAKATAVRRHAAMLLSALVATCYNQTGSFQLLKGSMLKVLTSVLFPDERQDCAEQLPTPALPTEALRDLVEDMRQYFVSSEREPRSFQIQVADLLNGFTSQIKAYEMWRSAISDSVSIHDFEEVEDGLFRVFQSLSALWVVDQKQRWLQALLHLHLRRGNFAEALVCKLRSIQVARDAAATSESGRSCDAKWIVQELTAAREYAERANWPLKEIEICEEMLAWFKKHRLYADYQSILRHLDRVVAKVSAESGSASHIDDSNDKEAVRIASGLAFYRVKLAGDSVSAHIARNEYIYKRSTFTSLGDFVGEMKTLLRAKYPMCERVDVVPESKPLPISDDQPNVIFMRVSSVEPAQDAPTHWLSKETGAVFRLSTPFTLSSSKTYGKTSEQLKRVTYMAVAHEFPCMLSRQVVQHRVELVRCPIETAMDDIRKRNALLRAEIRKEIQGNTDLKTLTLVLKGSVDTHVHGGIPEVIESFLAATAVAGGATESSTLVNAGCSTVNGRDINSGNTTDALPNLLTATGDAMSVEESTLRRHELANLLVEFAVVCCGCLLIGREAFRRCSTPTSSATVTASSLNVMATAASLSSSAPPSAVSAPVIPVSALSVLASETKTTERLSSRAARDSPADSTRSPGEDKSADEVLALLLPDTAALGASSGSDGSTSQPSESPLQQELERSFAGLVLLMHAQIRFPFANAAVLPALLQRLERLRLKAPTEPPTPPTERPTNLER